MYLGRIVSVGMTKCGRVAAIYRVSSRSFPNREAKIFTDSASIIPKPGFEQDIRLNPYIAYNCMRIVSGKVVVSNGSHTDPIAEKIASGMTMRDAIALSLLSLDYEKDSYDTPRIAGAVDSVSKKACLGIVRKNAICVEELALSPGKLFYVSTYEHNYISEKNCDYGFDSITAEQACGYILEKGIFAEFKHPVAAVAVLATDSTFDKACKNL